MSVGKKIAAEFCEPMVDEAGLAQAIDDAVEQARRCPAPFAIGECCFHATGEILTAPSPHIGETCCYCGTHRYRKTPFGSGGEHGPHRPERKADE